MDRLSFWFYRALAAVVGVLPLRVVFVLGEGVGLLAWLCAPGYRRLAARNLEIAFPEKSAGERAGILRRHFRTLGANILCSLKISRMPREEVEKLVEIGPGMELAEQMRQQKRGYILVISHIGNWELLSQISPLIWPLPLGTVYQRLGNPFIDAEVRASRARLGLELFERKEGFQGAIRMLRAGGGVGVLVDQHAGDAGVWVPFFGRLASTSSLAAMLALRTGAALLPLAVHTIGRGRWRMVMHGAVEPKPGERDVEDLTTRINAALERQIRELPEDWFWVHNRWKTPKPKFLLAGYKRGVAEGSAPLQPFRVVIRSSNWLGDAVISAPAVRAIKRGRPDLHLTVLTPAKLAGLWAQVPEVDSVLKIEPGEGVLAVARKLRAGRFEAAVLFPNSLRVALEAWLAGIPRRVGFSGHRRRWLLNQVWREKKKAKAAAPEHQVHHYLRLAEFIGADIASAGLVPAAKPAPGPLRVAVCVGAEYGPAKRWLPERFRATMEGFDPECEWVLVGVAKDAAIAEEVGRGFAGKMRNLVGKTTLEELAAELKGCTALLTNDTGTMHLASLLGVPVVAVFGSTEPALTGPLGDGHHVLREHVECSPCFLRECPLDFRCMKEVEAERAVSALREVAGQRGV